MTAAELYSCSVQAAFIKNITSIHAEEEAQGARALLARLSSVAALAHAVDLLGPQP